MGSSQGGKGETPVLRSTSGVQVEYKRSTVEYEWSIVEYSGVQRSTSGVQAEYVKYGEVLGYRSLAFSPLAAPLPMISIEIDFENLFCLNNMTKKLTFLSNQKVLHQYIGLYLWQAYKNFLRTTGHCWKFQW